MNDLPTKAAIIRVIQLYFDLEELKTLTQIELGIDLDSLPGEGKPSKARELVEHANRHGLAQALWDKIVEARPWVLDALKTGGLGGGRFRTGPLVMPSIPECAKDNGDAGYYRLLRDETVRQGQRTTLLLIAVSVSLTLSLITFLYIVFGG